MLKVLFQFWDVNLAENILASPQTLVNIFGKKSMYINGIIASKVNIKICINVCCAKIVLLIDLMDKSFKFHLGTKYSSITYSFVYMGLLNSTILY